MLIFIKNGEDVLSSFQSECNGYPIAGMQTPSGKGLNPSVEIAPFAVNGSFDGFNRKALFTLALKKMKKFHPLGFRREVEGHLLH